MTVTLREKLKYFSENEEYKEWHVLLSDWLKLTADEKIKYVCEHTDFSDSTDLKVWINMKTLKKQMLGIERVPRGRTLDARKYDVRKREVVYCGSAVLQKTADLFVIPTDDNEKDILLIFTIKIS